MEFFSSKMTAGGRRLFAPLEESIGRRVLIGELMIAADDLSNPSPPP